MIGLERAYELNGNDKVLQGGVKVMPEKSPVDNGTLTITTIFVV